ncbi:MAG: DUF4296 domain-containing protein [Bacteroidetes bacterium]|nr:DUF4296 domain-containing protein [Bacteroidota bacterium]
MTRIFFFFFFLSLIGCVDKDSVPSDIIQRDSMKIILWDVIEAEQYSKEYLLKDSLKINVGRETMKLYQEVFAIHHITKDQFNRSYEFYLSRPDLAKPLFDSLSAYANKQRNEMYKPKPVEKPKK